MAGQLDALSETGSQGPLPRNGPPGSFGECVELTAPLPTDRDECRELLDEVCLALWGGREWVKPERRARNLPRSWKPRVAPVPAEWVLE